MENVQHGLSAGVSGGPGENEVECLCGTTYAGFDTHAEAMAALERHIADPDGPVQDWYFTFGSGHPHDGRYVVINGTYDGAREQMFAAFGNGWAFQYPSAEAAGVERYGMQRLDMPASEPAPAAPHEPRRTVGLEVLTPALRAIANAARREDDRVPADAVVAIVARVDAEPVAVPEVDADWRTAWSHEPPDLLARLLRQARMYADGAHPEPKSELLMPGADVLAALAGRPLGGYTAAIEIRWGLVKPGWWALAQIQLGDGSADFVWQLIEDVQPCKRLDCIVSSKPLGGPCVVVTTRGRGVRHLAAYDPAGVRIPATTEIER